MISDILKDNHSCPHKMYNDNIYWPKGGYLITEMGTNPRPANPNPNPNTCIVRK